MRYHAAGLPMGAAALVLVTTIACQPSPTSTPREVLVRGADYLFELPDTLAPGTTVLRFRNTGKVDHEFGMALLKPGVTLAQVLDVVGAGGSPDSLLDGTVGILIAAPGATTVGALLVDLLPGRTYAMFCNFQDGPDKPPHSRLGMVTSRSIPGSP